VKGNVTRFLL